MIGWVTKRAVFEHLYKRIIETANNNCGYVADAGVIISDLADRLQGWLNEMDIVDAVPVVHGRWKYVSIERYACSVCGCEPWYGGSIYTLRYCPNCGARMDE